MARILAIALVILFTAPFNSSDQASASNFCEALVIDEAGIFGTRFKEVEEAARALVNAGADVRVRTIKSFGQAGTLAKYEKQIEKDCASWTAPDGGRKNNLIVLMISKSDRKTGIYFGSQWSRALEDRHIQVMTDQMNPRFRDGDFAGGFIAGLKSVTRMVDTASHPPVYNQQAPIVVVPPAVPSPPADYSGLWRVLLIILLIVLVLLVLGVLIKFAITYTQLKEKRRASQQKARLARQGCASRINEFPEKLKLAEIKVETVALNFSLEDLKPANELLAQAKLAYSNAAALFTDLDHSAGNPDKPNLTVTEYENIAKAYEPVLAQLREADQTLNKVSDAISLIEKLVNELPNLIAALPPRIESVKATIIAAKTVFDELVQNYSPATLESVRGNGTEATNRVNWSLKALEEARKLGSPEKKQWLKAQEVIVKITDRLDEAESLMRSINALQANLQVAKRDAPQELARAQNDLAACWDYMNKYDDDIRESLKDDLHAAEKRLEIAKEELGKARPHYLEVIGVVKDVQSIADNILAQEREEHETAERLRHKAVSSMRDAKAAVSKAREYIEDHKHHAGRTAERYLEEAKDLLTEAESTQDLKKRVDLAESAGSKANQAYSKARKALEEEYGSRHHRQGDTNVTIISSGGWGSPSPSPSSGGYSGSGDSDSDRHSGGSGGSDTSWGSSDSGGGSSTDFGSSGSGGGSDTSW